MSIKKRWCKTLIMLSRFFYLHEMMDSAPLLAFCATIFIFLYLIAINSHYVISGYKRLRINIFLLGSITVCLSLLAASLSPDG